jgi:hypothetical protein
MGMRTLLRVGLIQAAAYRRFVPACQLNNLSSGNLLAATVLVPTARIFAVL